MNTVTPRLDLDEEIVHKAKMALAERCGLSKRQANRISFADTAEAAMRLFQDRITDNLAQAGMRKQSTKRGRPRRIRDEFWQQLDEVANSFDTSRISILRAALALLAGEDEPITRRDKPERTKRSHTIVVGRGRGSGKPVECSYEA